MKPLGISWWNWFTDRWQVTLLEAEPEIGGKSLTVYDDAQPSVPQEPLSWDSVHYLGLNLGEFYLPILAFSLGKCWWTKGMQWGIQCSEEFGGFLKYLKSRYPQLPFTDGFSIVNNHPAIELGTPMTIRNPPFGERFFFDRPVHGSMMIHGDGRELGWRVDHITKW